jgi:hypothetical protein
MMVVPYPSLVTDRGHTSVPPQGSKVKGEYNCVGDPDQEGYRSLGKLLQDSFQYNVWARSFPYLETPDVFVNLVVICSLEFAGRCLKVQPQCYVNDFNNCRDRRVGHRLNLSLQSVSKVFGFLRVRESDSPGVTSGRRSRKSYHSSVHPPQRLVFGIEEFQCGTPLVVPQLVESTGH